jgi:translation initiation factor 1 (eIF-1/SUI1)
MIAFVIISLVLAYAKPEIEKFQDKSTIKQSIGIMSDLNSKISEISIGGEGNKRIMEVLIKKGAIIIGGVNDVIMLELESSYAYTEPGEEYSEQGVKIITEQKNEKNRILLISNYSGLFNITYSGKEEDKSFTQSPSAYSIYLENKGQTGSEKIIIDVGTA